MAEVIRMPRMSDTMEEGVIAAWHKKVGDKVKPGDLLAEVETDKATMELESYQTGTILYIGVEKGSAVKVNGIIAIIGKEGEDYKNLLEQSTDDRRQTTEKKGDENKLAVKNEHLTINNKQEAAVKTEVVDTPDIDRSSLNTRLKASPLAKKIASEKGVSLNQLQGSGDEGRIVKRDIESFLSSSAPGLLTKQPAVSGKESYEDIPLSQMRKTIAKRLSESKFTSPHFYLTMQINMDYATKVRASLNEVSSVKISFNDLVVKAVAAALKQHPNVNSSWLGDKIRINQHIHIGVAVAVEEGLLVPVVRFANEKTIPQIAAEIKDLAKKAKEKKLQPPDMQGNTFTVSNLGMFDIEEFTAIINPPDACILAVGSIKPTPVVSNGNIVVANMMKVTLSCDHRAVDGAMGSQFLQTLKSYLEDPVKLLL
jgi:pyruvate dehydrogenase E2 component (dihydrolipoamide acetyltransferase)